MKLSTIKPRFSVRALLVATAVLALFLWYHINWIQQRNQVRKAIIVPAANDIRLSLDVSPAIGQQADKKFPFALRLFGEQPRPWVHLTWNNDETWPEERERLKALFPEAEVIRVWEVEEFRLVTP